MYDFYDYMEKDPVEEIEYVKGMYDTQVHKVKQEEYMRDLLFAEYVRKVKSHVSRYDYMDGIFKDAQSQIGKKEKKEREDLTMLKGFIRDDFLSGNTDFEITRIISGGYESYYWYVEFKFYGLEYYIIIPIMKNINVKNIGSAYNGRFAFGVKESEHYSVVKKMSYKIEDVAEYIKEYLSLEMSEDEY